jgi:hypothetical protein
LSQQSAVAELVQERGDVGVGLFGGDAVAGGQRGGRGFDCDLMPGLVSPLAARASRMTARPG